MIKPIILDIGSGNILSLKNIISKKIKNVKKEKNSFIFDILKELNYENKNKVNELLNPINFFVWLVVSFKDIF